jgi:hypothetical protein
MPAMLNFMKNSSMNIVKKIVCIVLLFVIPAPSKLLAQNGDNWTKQQLMQPADLVKILQDDKNLPVLFSIGPGAYIPHSINIGMTRDKENLDKLKKQLKNLPKEKQIVIYCGCCPFDRCPNIRPAMQVLKDMKFTNYSLLNLEHNIKIDWINMGYPVAK